MEYVLNGRHIEVVDRLLKRTTTDEDLVFLGVMKGLVINFHEHILNLLTEARSVHFVGQPHFLYRVVTLGNQLHLDTVFLLHVVHELLLSERSFVNSYLVEDSLDGTYDDGIVLLGCDLGDGHWLRELVSADAEVDEGVLKVFELAVSLNNLVDLSRDYTGNHSGRGVNGRNDLNGNHLGLFSIAVLYGEVGSSEDSCSVDEINM